MSLEKLSTERRNPKSERLDEMNVGDALRLMNEEDANVPEAIKATIPQIEKAVNAVIESFEKGGRLIYMGAGTSGRLGVLDAAECPPTFGTDPEMVQGLIAGGEKAILKAVEGAEDSDTMGVEDLKALNLSNKDIVIGIAASGRTPYVIHAMKYAQTIGCTTIGVTNNQGSEIGNLADIAIEAVTGPEVLTGSTRLKAGSAQKMVLNMISTVSMVGIGKVYKNLMVDVQRTNIKLERRAIEIVKEAAETSREIATAKLKEANGHVKTAIIMILLECDKETAQQKLNSANSHVREALK